MLLEFFHKGGNLATLGGIEFLFETAHMPNFSNYINLSRSELPQKGYCFFTVFSDHPFLPHPNACPLLQ